MARTHMQMLVHAFDTYTQTTAFDATVNLKQVQLRIQAL